MNEEEDLIRISNAEMMGRASERERIIKLIEELIPAKPTYQMPMEYWVQCKFVEQAIALIKGEQKREPVPASLRSYHCPECDDTECLHCFCVEETNCKSCIEFANGEQK